MFEKNYSTITRTLNESSTMWSWVTGIFGSMTVSEWCLIITAIITIFNFVKNWYIDMRKLKMLEELHKQKLISGKELDNEK